MRWTFLLLILLLMGFSLQTEELHEISVHVTNIKSHQGNLMIAVYNCEENYMKKEFMHRTIPIDQENSKEFTLKLPPGHYAIGIFHDLNDNEELDKNFIGIPKEAFGFSNKSIGLFGPPSFKETKFTVPGNNQEVKVDLKQF